EKSYQKVEETNKVRNQVKTNETKNIFNRSQQQEERSNFKDVEQEVGKLEKQIKGLSITVSQYQETKALSSLKYEEEILTEISEIKLEKKEKQAKDPE